MIPAEVEALARQAQALAYENEQLKAENARLRELAHLGGWSA